jgi:hypothetical protein
LQYERPLGTDSDVNGLVGGGKVTVLALWERSMLLIASMVDFVCDVSSRSFERSE